MSMWVVQRRGHLLATSMAVGYPRRRDDSWPVVFLYDFRELADQGLKTEKLWRREFKTGGESGESLPDNDPHIALNKTSLFAAQDNTVRCWNFWR